MRLLAGMKWVVKEGAGVGASRRWVPWILGIAGFTGNSNHFANKIQNLPCQFLAASETVVGRFGPGWAKHSILGRAVGVWLLAWLWVAPMVLVTLGAAHRCFGKASTIGSQSGGGYVSHLLRQLQDLNGGIRSSRRSHGRVACDGGHPEEILNKRPH